MLEWRDVVGYEEFYQVSNNGRIKRKEHSVIVWNRYKYSPRRYKEKELKLSNDKDGYKLISLKGKSKRVHRLVAEAFIKNPNNLSQINHKNGDKGDNRVENLEWCDQSKNQQHKYDELGSLGPVGELNGNSKFDKDKVLHIKLLLEHSNLMQKDIAELTGVTPNYVSEIKLGRRWSHVTGYKYNGRNKKRRGK